MEEAADATDETIIKNKIRATDAKNAEYSFLLGFICLTPLSFEYKRLCSKSNNFEIYFKTTTFVTNSSKFI
jgi:hypothetical protein